MSVLQTNAFPVGYSAVTGNTGKSEAMTSIAGAETTAKLAPLSISNVRIFFARFYERGEAALRSARLQVREKSFSLFAMAMIWSMGEWWGESRFFMAANDRAVLHGMAAFETMLAIDGVIQHWEKHRRRLQSAVESMGLCDVSAYDFLSIGRELCAQNNCAEGRARLRLTVTAGAGSLAEKGPGPSAMAWLTAQACDVSPTTCKIVTLPWRRNERSALAGMKTSSYAENVLGLQWARAHGADEGIFFNTRDELCEACTANVFVRIDGEWHTPPLDSGCLPGVMREVLLERNPGIHKSIITREMFERAEQILLTSAIRGVTVVSACDDEILSDQNFSVRI